MNFIIIKVGEKIINKMIDHGFVFHSCDALYHFFSYGNFTPVFPMRS